MVAPAGAPAAAAGAAAARAPCTPDAVRSAAQSFAAEARTAAPAHSERLAGQPWSAAGPEAPRAAAALQPARWSWPELARGRRSCRPRRNRSRRSYRSCGLRRRWRRRSRKGRPRSRSRDYKSWRRRQPAEAAGRLRNRSVRSWRRGCDCRLGRRRRNRRRSCRGRGRLLLADDGFQNVAGLGNIGEIDLGLDLIGVGAARPGRPAGSLRCAGGAEVGADFLRFVVFERTGMGLLLGDSDFRKYVENRFAFDFQLPGQIVDSNLAHPPFRPPDCSAKSSYQPHGVSFQVRAAACVSARESHLLLLLGRSRLLRGFSCFFRPTIFFDGGVAGSCFDRSFRRGFHLGGNVIRSRGCLFRRRLPRRFTFRRLRPLPRLPGWRSNY